MGLAASAIAFAVAVGYVVLIFRGAVGFQGAEVWVACVTVVLFLQSYVVMQGTLRFSVPLMALGTAMLLVTAVLGLFSIGAPLAIAGILAALATGYVRLRQQAAADRARRARPRSTTPGG